ncbi:mannosyl-oligosaccharide glucosidase [Trichomonascus vanleenenianus]|uniref:mannosyl-oligosaccharide glucosidase n=1 Tax=Trichomonascus vanleenenianus TaxID=2268995 RepID=UPI003ECA7B54
MLVTGVLWAFLWCFVRGSDLSKSYDRLSNDSLLWNPYRSNLYFGVRPNGIPHSLMSGLMWYNADTYQGIQNIRHSCEQLDNMATYGWTSYDPRVGGSQIIKDIDNKVSITTSFVKSEDGKNWAVRVKGEPIGDPRAKTTVVFYSALEGEGVLDLASKLDPKGMKGTIQLRGESPELGKFSLDITEGPSSNVHPVAKGHPLEAEKPTDRSHYASLTVPDDRAWQAKEIFLTLAQETVNELAERYSQEDAMPAPNVYYLSDNTDILKGRMHYVQKIFQGKFEFDVIYNVESNESPITPKSIGKMITRAEKTMDTKFSDAFHFNAPFTSKKFASFAKEMYSNLVGGMNYFYGNQLVDRAEYETEDEENFWEVEKPDAEVVEEGPRELLTLVPSRSFFPRGFYWDEGFHLIPVLEYDSDLVMEILKSWFSQVDEDGWIAREQILGPEARSKVPSEFQTQYPQHANPPTLMILLSKIVKKVEALKKGGTDKINLGSAHIENPQLLHDYVKEVYPNLQLHYDWFRSTQKGSLKEWDREAFSSSEGYRWRGRTPRHCLASGLDDYPRAAVPHTGELHVDLISWIGMMTRSMKDFARIVDDEDDYEEYSKIEDAIMKNIDDLHWNEKEKCYCDKTIDEFEEDVFVCHKGYITLFPFILQLIPEDKIEQRVLPLLDLIKDPEQLWSDYGIRSLAKSNEYFGTDEDYWRGPVWVNINYLILDAMVHYAGENEKVRKAAAPIYKELRTNLVKNVYNQWKKTGFAWEQYDSESGKAKGVKHFLGWTSLVVNIMAMPEELGAAIREDL